MAPDVTVLCNDLPVVYEVTEEEGGFYYLQLDNEKENSDDRRLPQKMIV